jgi:hypothetical protein
MLFLQSGCQWGVARRRNKSAKKEKNKEEVKINSSRKTDGSSKQSKISGIPFPITMQEAEKRIIEQDHQHNLFSPNMERKTTEIGRKDQDTTKKQLDLLYDSPISKKLKNSLVEQNDRDRQLNGFRASLSSIKPSKPETETDSDFKVKRTVFNDYKEHAKLPLDIRKQQRETLKRGSRYTNSIDHPQYNEAIIEDEKFKHEPNRIIKKIAETYEAWQSTRRLKNSRNMKI